MSNQNQLAVNPAPHISAPMSKNRLMQYTFAALLAITIVSAILWWQVTTPTNAQIDTMKLTGFIQMPLGAIVLINAVIAVGVAVGADALISKTASDAQLNIWSAAVFGLIVTLSYSLGVPQMAQATDMMPVETLSAPGAFIYVALISLIGLVLFKKLQGLAGRKFVNPAAAAKMIVLLPFVFSVFLAKDHFASYEAGGLGVPNLAGALGGGSTPVGTNGIASFTTYLQGCYLNPSSSATPDIYNLMILEKFHGWTGGACSLAVIIIGIAFFLVARKYIKWRITLSYFVAIAIMSVLMSTIYADTDITLRLLFSVFMGSSIFLGFFMATDPATTPFTGFGQIIFGVGLAVLTVLIQTYMNFFGGSLLALLIMNLTVPLIDKINIRKPFGR